MTWTLAKTWVAARWNQWLGDERGQGMVEYGLIIALVAIAVIGALTYLGDELYALFVQIVCTLNPSNTACGS